MNSRKVKSVTASMWSINDWNWNIMNQTLSINICFKTASFKPLTIGQDSFPIWKLSTYYPSNIKFAYKTMSDEDPIHYESTIFNLVWKWVDSPRICIFIWKIYHGRLLTKEERHHRSMSDDDICIRCNDKWSSFLSLELSQWIDSNHTLENFSSMKGNWSIVFDIVVNILWLNRNQFFFRKQYSFIHQHL